jgi:hypothetical protein
MSSLVQSTALESPAIGLENRMLAKDDLPEGMELSLGQAAQSIEHPTSDGDTSETAASTGPPDPTEKKKAKKPRKLVAEEQKNVGVIERQVKFRVPSVSLGTDIRS